MFGIIKYIFDSRTFRYLLVFLLGATLGTAGGHALLTEMWHGFATLFGIHPLSKPTIRP